MVYDEDTGLFSTTLFNIDSARISAAANNQDLSTFDFLVDYKCSTTPSGWSTPHESTVTLNFVADVDCTNSKAVFTTASLSETYTTFAAPADENFSFDIFSFPSYCSNLVVDEFKVECYDSVSECNGEALIAVPYSEIEEPNDGTTCACG